MIGTMTIAGAGIMGTHIIDALNAANVNHSS